MEDFRSPHSGNHIPSSAVHAHIVAGREFFGNCSGNGEEGLTDLSEGQRAVVTQATDLGSCGVVVVGLTPECCVEAQVSMKK